MRLLFVDNDVYYNIIGCRCISVFKYLDVYKVYLKKEVGKDYILELMWNNLNNVKLDDFY